MPLTIIFIEPALTYLILINNQTTVAYVGEGVGGRKIEGVYNLTDSVVVSICI